MVSKKTVNMLLAGAVALTAAAGFQMANAEDAAKEKCYGVVKAGMNDCASKSGSHSCAGHATTDGDAGEWIGLPAGVCAKLVNGTADAAATPAETHEEHGEEAAH